LGHNDRSLGPHCQFHYAYMEDCQIKAWQHNFFEEVWECFEHENELHMVTQHNTDITFASDHELLPYHRNVSYRVWGGGTLTLKLHYYHVYLWVSLVRVNLVPEPNMYPPLIKRLELRSSQQMPCDGTHANKLSIRDKYVTVHHVFSVRRGCL